MIFYLLMVHLRAMMHFKLKLLPTMFMVHSDNIIIALRSLFYNIVDALSATPTVSVKYYG